MNGAAADPGTSDRARETVVTGMGFCLPGRPHPVCTAQEVWDMASRGRTCLLQEEVRHGAVNLPAAVFEEKVPGMPPFFADSYTAVHRFGLVSLTEACRDAGLDLSGGELSEAAVLAGRAGIDSNVDSYLSIRHADAAKLSGLAAVKFVASAALAMNPSDVALVQSALARSRGPCFTVSSGCCSSAVLIGIARQLISAGQADLVAVTGADAFGLDVIKGMRRLLWEAQQEAGEDWIDGMPDVLPSCDVLMRPYDRRARDFNYGEGAATVILESREHAVRRGARPHVRVLAAATTRDGLVNPLAKDKTGDELARTIRTCLPEGWRPERIGYVHSNAEGTELSTTFEAAAVRQLWGDRSDLLLTTQSGCFGLLGGPMGALGVALTALMIGKGEVCPTTNCEQPADGLPFDPVPGPRTRPLPPGPALCLDYQVGGVKSAILLDAPDAG